MDQLRYFLPCFALFLLAPWPALSGARSSNVRGAVELINAKIKGRDGRIDASGVIVWLQPLDAPPPRAPRTRRVLTQRGKRFIPHVMAVEFGAAVDFPNEDPFFHNVFSIYDGKRFDLGLYASGETQPVIFNRPGVSYIFCNIHPQMSAVVVALETPYFAVSDPRGLFTINGVQAGRYQLNVWHERAKPEQLAALSRTIQVSAADSDLGVLRISEEGYLPRPHKNKHGEDYDLRRGQPAYRKP